MPFKCVEQIDFYKSPTNKIRTVNKLRKSVYSSHNWFSYKFESYQQKYRDPKMPWSEILGLEHIIAWDSWLNRPG